jgi:hypothetical protein
VSSEQPGGFHKDDSDCVFEGLLGEYWNWNLLSALYIFVAASAKILTCLEKLYTLRLEGGVDDADKPNDPASWRRVTLPEPPVYQRAAGARRSNREMTPVNRPNCG